MRPLLFTLAFALVTPLAGAADLDAVDGWRERHGSRILREFAAWQLLGLGPWNPLNVNQQAVQRQSFDQFLLLS